MSDGRTLLVNVINHNLDYGVDINLTLIIGNQSLLGSVECQTLTLNLLNIVTVGVLNGTTEFGNVVQTQNHILCRHCDRSTVGRVKDIV